MIIQNGWAEIAQKGQTVEPEGTNGWGAKIPCQYVLTQQNQQATAGETPYQGVQWEVYLPRPVTLLNTPLVRLTDLQTQETLGVYKVQTAEWLQAVLQTRLTVERI
jgi:hypothetical protein